MLAKQDAINLLIDNYQLFNILENNIVKCYFNKHL